MWDDVVRKRNIQKSNNRLFYICASLVLVALITCDVYYFGGTQKVYTNLMYIPITLIASTCGKRCALMISILAGLLIGPYMPLNVEQGISQTPVNWLIRLAIYIVVGQVVGYFVDKYKKNAMIMIKKENEIAEAQMGTIYALVKLSETRDDASGTHIERVAETCKFLAEELRKNPKHSDTITDTFIENIYKASTLHDIGKVGIPDIILLKPGKLSKEEFDVMKNHTIIGADTLIKVMNKNPHSQFIKMGIEIVQNHHEKWDGSGYPSGLKGDEIPLSARIMAIADVYDALRSVRVYKKAYSHEESLEIIKEGSGHHFDPEIVSIFFENEKIIDNIFKTVSISVE